MRLNDTKHTPNATCEICGTAFFVYPSSLKQGRGRFCSVACRGLCRRTLLGPDSPTWKGGTVVETEGYIGVYVSPGKRVGEHRLVMEQVLGRPLLPTEHVHHKDRNVTNNDPSNLVVLSASQHKRLHVHEMMAQPRPWSRRYDACVSCGRTEHHHEAKGYCYSCYHLIRRSANQ